MSPETIKGCYYDWEICCVCGRSVAAGSGQFVNRVPELNDFSVRIAIGRAFPRGGWICESCDCQRDYGVFQDGASPC